MKKRNFVCLLPIRAGVASQCKPSKKDLSDKVTGRWFSSDFDSVQPFGTSSTLPFQRTFPNTNRFVKLGWTRALSATKVNDFRYGFNRFTFGQVPDEPISLSDIGAVRGNSDQFPAAFRINVSGAFTMGTKRGSTGPVSSFATPGRRRPLVVIGQA